MAGDGTPLVIQVGVGEPRFGLWCPHCLKPSGYSCDIYSLTNDGVSPLARLEKCDDCDQPLTQCESD